MDMSLSKLRALVMEREAWHADVHGVVQSQTWLSDWTELIFVTGCYYQGLKESNQEWANMPCYTWYSMIILNYFVWFSYMTALGFPCGLDGKASTWNVEDPGSIPALGIFPGGGHGNPLWYSCLEYPQGHKSLVGYSPWGHKKLDMTEWLRTAHAAIPSLYVCSFWKSAYWFSIVYLEAVLSPTFYILDESRKLIIIFFWKYILQTQF